jgi:hypothetical protein
MLGIGFVEIIVRFTLMALRPPCPRPFSRREKGDYPLSLRERVRVRVECEVRRISLK